jgi:hypothetical protein
MARLGLLLAFAVLSAPALKAQSASLLRVGDTLQVAGSELGEQWRPAKLVGVGGCQAFLLLDAGEVSDDGFIPRKFKEQLRVRRLIDGVWRELSPAVLAELEQCS